MPELHNPYAVSAVLMREAAAKEPVFPEIHNPLKGINFSSALRAEQLIALKKDLLGLDPAASQEQLDREIRLHEHVDKFIKDMQKISELRFKYPLLSKIISPRAELKIPLEYIDSERKTEVLAGKHELRLGIINLSLLSFNCLTMAQLLSKNMPAFPSVLLLVSAVQVHISILNFVRYNRLKSIIVRLPSSLNDIKNSSVKRLLQAVKSHGYYTKYYYDHNCIQIELSNKPKDLPVARELN